MQKKKKGMGSELLRYGGRAGVFVHACVCRGCLEAAAMSLEC